MGRKLIGYNSVADNTGRGLSSLV